MASELKNVLITGASGLVGSFIARRLLALGFQVHGTCRDTTDFSLLAGVKNHITWHTAQLDDLPALQEAMTGMDVVIHAAAIVNFGGLDPAEIYKANVEGTANVVNTCLALGTPRLVHISSVAALGAALPGQPLNEDARWNNQGFITHYARSKYLAEVEVWRAQAEGLTVAVLNPSVVLGPGFTDRGGSTTLLAWVRNGRRFYTKGFLNYVDVRDVALAAEMALTQFDNQRMVLNAGTLPFDQFFGQVAQQLGVKPPDIQLPKLLAEIGWRAERLRTLLTGSRPFITKETARNAFRQSRIDGSRITRQAAFNYTPLQETLQFTLAQLKARGW